MTTDDVVFSLGRQMDPDNAAAWAQVFQNVASITKSSPLQVTVKLNKADSQFPQYMATVQARQVEQGPVDRAGALRRLLGHQGQGEEGRLPCPDRADGQSDLAGLERPGTGWGMCDA
ncbi:ABC transporter substrate-binding protein [Streptomyces sp. NPDC048257]|uniref:ABC transporter substrate-binding protein n=1 Tax=Streptomyces sp. NPDC048257 TaxID=3365526 RepID=UPI0037101118